VAVDLRGWRRIVAGGVTCAFLVGDISFLIANYFKIAAGGWLPLLVASVVFVLMTTWREGKNILNTRSREGALSPEMFVASLKLREPIRIPGTAVFMQPDPEVLPSSLLHSLKHYKSLHERVILLSISSEEVSHVPERERFTLEELGAGMFRMKAHYGYIEDIDVPALIERAQEKGLTLQPMDTTYFLGRETPIITARPGGMMKWRQAIFASMIRNAESAGRFFRLPPNRVVELGAQVEL
jgi:KUP system potassium uptake protein